ncbi:hypothetical protein U1Q18_011814 [Sarracenia purpurea var. burkii]
MTTESEGEQVTIVVVLVAVRRFKQKSRVFKESESKIAVKEGRISNYIGRIWGFIGCVEVITEEEGVGFLLRL